MLKHYFMTDISRQTLAAMVAEDHRTARILEKYKLDYCCKGKRTLSQACEEGQLTLEDVVTELAALPAENKSLDKFRFAELSADLLTGHIILHHHLYTWQTMPQIEQHLYKVAFKHGSRYPYMVEVYSLFCKLRAEMSDHLLKEEKQLFPAIRRLELYLNDRSVGFGDMKVVEEWINGLESEHDEAGMLMHNIRELTRDYQIPEGACTTFRLALAELKEFEENLHQHVHLENHLLFPRVLELGVRL